jgi:hypothetical protein
LGCKIGSPSLKLSSDLRHIKTMTRLKKSG